MRATRAIRIALGVILALVIGVIATTLLLLDSRWGTERVRRLVVDRANRALVGTLSVQQIRGSLIGGDVRLVGVVLTQDGFDVFKADEVQLRYNVSQVYSGRSIAEVVLTRPRVVLAQDPRTGQWNIAHLTRSSGGGKRPRFGIDRLQMIGGDIEVRPKDAAVRRLSKVDTVLRLQSTADQFDTSIKSFSGRDPDTGVAIRSLSTDLRVAGGDLTFDRLHLGTDRSVLDGRVLYRTTGGAGTSGPRTPLEFDVTTKPLVLRELGAYFPAIAGYPESAAVEARASGSFDAFRATWALASAAGAGTGQLTGSFLRDELALTGDVDAKGFKVAEWFNAPALPPVVDVKSTYTLRLPVKEPTRVRVEFDAAVPAARIADLDFGHLRGKGTYADGTVKGRGSAAFYGGNFTGAGEWNKDSRAYSGEGTFDGVSLKALPAQLRAPRLASNLTGRARFEGGPSRYFVDAVLAPSIVEDATVDDGFVATIDGRSREVAYRAHGMVRHLDPRRFTPLVDTPPAVWQRAAGEVDADVTVDGHGNSLASTVLTARLRIPRASVAGVALEDADLQVRLAACALALDLTTPAFRLTDDPLGYQTGALAAGGGGTVSVRFSDVSRELAWEEISGASRLTIATLSARGIALTGGEVDASLADGRLAIKALELHGDNLTARASGALALAGSGTSDLHFAASAGDLARFKALIGRDVSGGGSVEGTVTSSASQPVVAGTAKASELAVDVFSALTANATFSARLPEWDVMKAVGTADATGAFVKVSGTRLDEVIAKTAFDAGTVTVDARLAQGARAFDLGGVVVPHPDHREVHLRRMTFTAGNTTWTLAPGQEATVQYGDRELLIKGLNLRSGTAVLDVAGAVGERAAEPLRIVAAGVAVEDLNQMALGTHDIRGLLDGTVTVSGPLGAPTVQGKVTVTNGQVEGLAFSALAATARYDHEVISLDVSLEAGQYGSLTAVGTVPYARGVTAASLPPYDVTVKSSTLDLGFLQPMTNAVENLRGTGQLDVRVRGEAKAPSFDGTIAMVDASFRVPSTGISYARLNADLALAGQQITVNRFRIEDDDGHPATIEGSLKVPGLTDSDTFELLIKTDELHLLKNQFGEVAITSDLQALGTISTPLVSGTIRVDRGRIEATDLLDRLTASGYRTTPTSLPVLADQAAAATPVVGNSYDRSSLSITLDLPGNVVVRGRDLRTRGGGPIGFGDVNVTIDGALSIAKESGAPATLLGRVDVVRGQYQFQGRAFTITRGSELRFQGSPTNPAVDVTAERTISGVTARVQVAGTLAQPEINLSSDPPLDQGDVLSLIVFNQTMNELPGSERVSLAARAGALAAGAIATPISDSVARALDLDLFEIRPSDTAGGGASVRVGRQVSDRLFLGFSQDFGREDVSQLSFEYRLNQIISVVTTIAHGSGVESTRRRAQEAGIDLIFIVR
jgi:hypothetical protein